MYNIYLSNPSTKMGFVIENSEILDLIAKTRNYALLDPLIKMGLELKDITAWIGLHPGESHEIEQYLITQRYYSDQFLLWALSHKYTTIVDDFLRIGVNAHRVIRRIVQDGMIEWLEQLLDRTVIENFILGKEMGPEETGSLGEETIKSLRQVTPFKLLHWSAKYGWSYIFQFVLDKYRSELNEVLYKEPSILITAIQGGDLDVIEKALEIESPGPLTLIDVIAQSRSTSVMEYFEARWFKSPSDLDSATIQEYHDRGLLISAKVGSIPAIKHFLDHGANLHVMDKESDALLLSIQYGHIDAVQYLISLNAKTAGREGLLINTAITHRHPNIVDYFLALKFYTNEELLSRSVQDEFITRVFEGNSAINPELTSTKPEFSFSIKDLEIIKFLTGSGRTGQLRTVIK